MVSCKSFDLFCCEKIVVEENKLIRKRNAMAKLVNVFIINFIKGFNTSIDNRKPC